MTYQTIEEFAAELGEEAIPATDEKGRPGWWVGKQFYRKYTYQEIDLMYEKLKELLRQDGIII